MFQVLLYLMKSSRPLVSEKDVERIPSMTDAEWKSFVGEVRGTIVTQPGKMPSSVRVDQVLVLVIGCCYCCLPGSLRQSDPMVIFPW